jgi:hypothetical protein
VPKVHFAVSDLLWGDEAPVLVSRCCLGFGTNALKQKFFDDSWSGATDGTKCATPGTAATGLCMRK